MTILIGFSELNWYNFLLLNKKYEVQTSPTPKPIGVWV